MRHVTKGTVQHRRGLGYGFDIEELGLNVRANVAFSEEWRAAPGFIYYFDGIEGITVYEINLNGHYVYIDTGNFRSYALGGINILGISFGEGNGTTDTGLNIGNGIEIPFSDTINGFGELRYVLGGSEQLLLNAGITFTIE